LQFHRFKREEMKIHAWENHQKAKTEAEMRKIEVFNTFFSSLLEQCFYLLILFYLSLKNKLAKKYKKGEDSPGA